MFWHGIGESELFRRMKAERWLDLFYSPFSEEVHGAVSSVADTLSKLTKDHVAQLGPTYGDPRLVIGASFEMIAQCLLQIDTMFDLGRRAEAEAISRRMKDALSAYAEKVDAGTKIGLVFEQEDPGAGAKPEDTESGS